MLTIKPLIIYNSSKKETKSRVVEQRKADVKSIFKVFQDVSKKEIERSKQLFEDHINWFEYEPIQETGKQMVPIQINTNEDSFFEK
jgi:DNA repair photolyase